MPNKLKKLQKVSKQAYKMLESCCICPRKCRVNRLQGEKGFCKTGAKPRICNFMPHFGEEPPISGKRGSGTVFFSGCNMACAYCQNYKFSQLGEGREIEIEDLANIILQLQDSGCHNLNLVTPTHVMPQILKALLIAITKGFKMPIVYNTGGYELPEMIKLLDGIVDVYLPDARYADNEMAIKYSSASGYPDFNRRSLKEMHRQAGIPEFDGQGIVKRGLIVRCLVLPNNISGTKETMNFISRELSEDTYISLMSQYTPYYQANKFKEISRRITHDEYDEAAAILQKNNLSNGWTQDAGGLERFAGIHIKPAF